VCFCGVCKLLILERETGVEPATSSLGISASIAYIKDMASTAANTDPWSFSNLRPLLFQQPLNGVETEWKISGDLPSPLPVSVYPRPVYEIN